MIARGAVAGHWDAIGIGTSPLMLLRAAAMCRSGSRVLLIDRGTQVGGSWRAAQAFGRENVELGVHLIENRPEVAEILRGAAGVQLREDPPGLNYAIVQGRRVPFGASRVLLHALVAGKALLGRDKDKARRMARSTWRALCRMPHPFAYPAAGMQSVLAALLDRLRAGGGAVLLGTEVLEVAPGPAGARVQLADRVLDCGSVIFASRAHAPVAAGGAPALRFERSVVRNAVLHFAGRWRRPTGYVEAIGDPSVKRVRDVGRIAGLAEPGLAQRPDGIACVQLRAPGPADEAVLATWLVGQLKRLDLVEADVRPLGVIRHDVELATATDASLRRLGASVPWITVLPSTDLAEEIAGAAEWADRQAPAAGLDERGVFAAA